MYSRTIGPIMFRGTPEIIAFFLKVEFRYSGSKLS